MGLRPSHEGAAGEFRPVVGTYRVRITTEDGRPIQQPGHILAADAVVGSDVHTLVAEIIGHGQALDAPAIGHAVTHEIHAPHLINALRDLERDALAGWPLGLLTHPHRQVGGTVDPIHALVIHLGKLRAQQVMDAPIAKASPGLGNGLKRNFQVMPGAQWLELLCKHIPDRHEHLVRYVGWYSNRARGERAKALKAQQPAKTPPAAEAAVSEFATRAKATWARLIRKVYEADPLVCPKCKGPMRVIALIDDPAVVRRILKHLGRWAPEPAERGPPAQAPDWPRNAVIPITYRPVSDIA